MKMEGSEENLGESWVVPVHEAVEAGIRKRVCGGGVERDFRPGLGALLLGVVVVCLCVWAGIRRL